MNFFRPKTAAERYARGRPFFHPLVINRIKEFLSLAQPLTCALDVGCGTGLSTVALREIAARVVGVDASPAMVALAPQSPGIHYLVARGERLPFGAGVFDLLTVSQAVHWLDRGAFLAEARRVVRAGGWLVVYDDYFSGELERNDGFRAWFRDSYLGKYPSPPRAWASFEAEETAREGFRLLAHESLRNTVRFSREGLVNYLLTQSNVIAAVEGGGEDADAARVWLTESVAPFFADARDAEFLFNAPVWIIQHAQNA